jgi:hypothetical protein
MGCFAFKSGKNRRSKKPKPVASPAKTPPSSSDSSGQNKGKAASTPTRSIQELSEERGAQRLRLFDLDELRSATNGFSRALKLGEGGFGSVYRAFFRSAGGGRVVLAVKRLNQRSQQVSSLLASTPSPSSVTFGLNLFAMLCPVCSSQSFEFPPSFTPIDTEGLVLLNHGGHLLSVTKFV